MDVTVEPDGEAIDAETMNYMKRVAKAKDDAAREALLDLMSPYAFTVVAFDSLQAVNEQWKRLPSGRVQWSMDGVRVIGATLLFEAKDKGARP